METAVVSPVGRGIMMLLRAGVELVVVGPAEVVVAGYARNLDRIVRVLQAREARLLLMEGSEDLDVPITAAFLRSEQRSAWCTADGARVALALEPLPGLDFRALLLDAPLRDPDDDGPPWACADHREALAAIRR
ncbi:MAG: hypothetical protein JWO90_3111 [Solirubrobacterales bacterium]|jgi:hypothetical protein|nr:hypothetical protein [Solirubrobacterales bacterium]